MTVLSCRSQDTMVTLGLTKFSSSVKGADLQGTCRETLQLSAVSIKYFLEIARCFHTLEEWQTFAIKDSSTDVSDVAAIYELCHLDCRSQTWERERCCKINTKQVTERFCSKPLIIPLSRMTELNAIHLVLQIKSEHYYEAFHMAHVQLKFNLLNILPLSCSSWLFSIQLRHI